MIYVTIDGTTPTLSSPIYRGPIHADADGKRDGPSHRRRRRLRHEFGGVASYTLQ